MDNPVYVTSTTWDEHIICWLKGHRKVGTPTLNPKPVKYFK